MCLCVPGIPIEPSFYLPRRHVSSPRELARSHRAFARRKFHHITMLSLKGSPPTKRTVNCVRNLYRDQTRVLETPPATIKDDVGKVKNIASLPVGAYDCQVKVLNSATQKSAVWRWKLAALIPNTAG